MEQERLADKADRLSHQLGAFGSALRQAKDPDFVLLWQHKLAQASREAQRLFNTDVKGGADGIHPR